MSRVSPLPSTYVPLRIFLDSNVMQALLEHGGTVFEGEPYEPGGRSGAGEEDVWALCGLMAFVERGAFELIVSPNSLHEAAGDRRQLTWTGDVMHHSAVCLAENPPASDSAARAARLDGCGYLSVKDRRLLQDAVAAGCDTFLTVERKLPRNAAHLSRTVGIEVLRPPQLWAVLSPHVVAL